MVVRTVTGKKLIMLNAFFFVERDRDRFKITKGNIEGVIVVAFDYRLSASCFDRVNFLLAT